MAAIVGSTLDSFALEQPNDLYCAKVAKTNNSDRCVKQKNEIAARKFKECTKKKKDIFIDLNWRSSRVNPSYLCMYVSKFACFI